jgi:membrane fusion protein (multidrug efflux system)
MPPAEVSVVTAQPQNVPVSFEYVGQASGYREVEVRARVTGILLKRLYREGGPVRAGQPLFQIDPAPFEAALSRAEAELARAEAEQARAQREMTRVKSLYAKRTVSQKEYDDAVSAAQVAKAEVQVARAQVTEARLNLGYTRVEAPIAGLSGRALKSEGSLVSGTEATLLTTLSQVDPLYVLFAIPDGDLLDLNREAAAGQIHLPEDGRFQATLRLSDGSTYEQAGKVDFSDNRIDTATGTVEARIELPNPDGRLRPGQFVRVILSGAERLNAFLVPQRAVQEGPNGKFVYVVNGESKTEVRPVEVGDWVGEQWVVHAGLKAGDRVIVDGALKIQPGAPVQLAAPSSEKATPVPGLAAAAGHPTP